MNLQLVRLTWALGDLKIENKNRYNKEKTLPREVSLSLVKSRGNVRDFQSHETNFGEIIAALTIQ